MKFLALNTLYLFLLKNIFSDSEIIDFYEYINYNDFKIVLVEPNNKNSFQTKEKIYV